jgi:hypothetical protein
MIALEVLNGPKALREDGTFTNTITIGIGKTSVTVRSPNEGLTHAIAAFTLAIQKWRERRG